MRALFFGTYERTYPRNAQVASCLRTAGVEVRERHEPVWQEREHWQAGIGAALRLAVAEARLAASRDSWADLLLVGYPGHPDLPAARLAARGRPVAFNPLVSLYDTLVEDRGRFARESLPARALRMLDRAALRAADLVVADTAANAAYLAGLAGIDHVPHCFVGAEERLFGPPWEPAEPFTALFVGKLIPLHGLGTILEAGRLDPRLRIRVVGDGQLRPLLAARSANVEHVPWVPYEALPAELHRAGCALGIFGAGAKAARVIPNKAFQALACGVPLVTADTPAARELLADGESALLVPPEDAGALAEAIARLESDPELARRIGDGGRRAYETVASEQVLGERWRGLLASLL